MNYDDTASQTVGTAIALALSQGMPPFIGRGVASAIACVIGNRWLSASFQAIRVNQWVVHNGRLCPRGLRQAIRKVYQNQSRALYDFYHYLDRPDEIRKMVNLSPRFQTMMDECMSGRLKQGTMLLMPHLGGFNLAGLHLAQLGFKFLTLAIPAPNRGYAWQNKLRNDRGMEVLPMNVSAMQLARQRLQNGGTVLTGVDRPIEDPGEYTPLFFDRPAPLPVAYVKLALKTNCRVFAIGFQTLRDRTCLVDASPEIFMERSSDQKHELLINAQKILKALEGYIRLDPSQWMMFLPVWPDAEKEIPAI